MLYVEAPSTPFFRTQGNSDQKIIPDKCHNSQVGSQMLMSQWYLQLSHTHLYRIVHTYMHNMGKNNSQTGILTVGMSVIIIATYTLPLS